MSVLSRLQKRFSYPLLSGQSVGRILRRSLLLLLALMAVILSAFYLTLRTLNQESYLRERYRQSLSLLQQTDRSLQVSLNHLETQSTAFLSSFDVTGVMVRQGQADFDQRYQVVSGLADLPQNSPLVTAAWLYLLQAGSVFCSDQQIQLLPDCSPTLQTLLTGSESGLFVQQGQLYYKLGYPQNEPLGLLLLQLDTSALYRSTFNQTQSVYIYAQDMTPLFSAACRYPDDAALADTVYQSALSAFYRSADAKSSYYTLYRSVSTGLNYLTIESAVSFLPALQDSLRLLLPCGALILLGTALFSLYSLHSVYRPIQHALDVLVSAPAADAAPLPSEPPRLRQTLSAVAPDVFLLLFRRILYGGMSDPAEIEQSLEGLPPVFPVDAPYLVLRLRPSVKLPPRRTSCTGGCISCMPKSWPGTTGRANVRCWPMKTARGICCCLFPARPWAPSRLWPLPPTLSNICKTKRANCPTRPCWAAAPPPRGCKTCPRPLPRPRRIFRIGAIIRQPLCRMPPPPTWLTAAARKHRTFCKRRCTVKRTLPTPLPPSFAPSLCRLPSAHRPCAPYTPPLCAS